MNEESDSEALLRLEIALLGVDDILALCYSFKHRPERLRLYLDVLRKRGGERAQFASCLICFDLARQGDGSFQAEFNYLADTMRQLAAKVELVQNLLGGDQYLSFLWELCQAQLAEMDPRVTQAEPLPGSTSDVGTLDLLSDADFADFGIQVDHSALWRRFDEAVETFLGGEAGVPVYNPDAGYRMGSRRDTERTEKFLQELESLREPIPPARGFRALTLLYYGTHLRSRSIFGAINQRKQSLIREGLKEFVRSGQEVAEIVGVLGPLHAPPEVWEKVSEIIVDYIRWLDSVPASVAQNGPEAYDAVERLVERQPPYGNRRKTDRF